MTSTAPTPDQLEAYRKSMEVIFQRISQAQAALALGVTERLVEVAALDLRKALEGLLLSSLVTHLDSLAPITTALERQKPSDARRLVEQLNPGWWPNPQNLSAGGPDHARVDWTITGHHDDDFMTSDEWGMAFGSTSRVLHQANPFAKPRSIEEAHADLIRIASRVHRLLRAHTVSIGVDGVLIAVFQTRTGLEVGRLDKVEDWQPSE